ncbi:MAG: BON domain-containing protein [Burkholderiaceae bacterium]
MPFWPRTLPARSTGRRFQSPGWFESGSLRRWVFLQGCVASPKQAAQLEQAAQAVPGVEAVVPMLNVGADGKPRYEIARPGH